MLGVALAMKPSAAATYERARRLANLSMWAIHLQHRRLHSVEPEDELHEILQPVDVDYRRKYLEKHGEEYGHRRGVVNLSRSQAEPYRDRWGTILDLLKEIEPTGGGVA